ncbi:MAG: hypothetical protein WC391_04640 [Methanoregula sp.]
MTCCEKHKEHSHAKTCKLCKSEYCHDCHPSVFGICEKCAYKILIVLFIIMIATAYVAWFAVI